MAEDFLDLLESACAGRLVQHETGAALFHRGDSVRWFHVVKSGRIRLSRVLAEGGEIALARVGKGQVLAEASVFSPRYHCDAVAEIASTTIRYAIREIVAMLREHPVAALAYGAYLAAHLMELRSVAEIRAIRRADERLLAWLHMEGGAFDGRGAWPSVARQLGLTAESTYRALATLERSGRIRRVAGKIAIV